jgi:hypothetical protein
MTVQRLVCIIVSACLTAGLLSAGPAASEPITQSVHYSLIMYPAGQNHVSAMMASVQPGQKLYVEAVSYECQTSLTGRVVSARLVTASDGTQRTSYLPVEYHGATANWAYYGGTFPLKYVVEPGTPLHFQAYFSAAGAAGQCSYGLMGNLVTQP